MRRRAFAVGVALAASAGIASPASAKNDRSIVGQIMDSTCLARGEAPDADHADCARRCIQGGAPIAVVEDKTHQVFIALAPVGESVKDKLLPYVGRRCKIAGEVVRRGGSQFLIVREVAPEHEHNAKEGGVVAMAGDLHLEAVVLRSGEVRVYLTDAFRKSVALAGRSGRAEVGGSAQSAPRSAALAPEPSGRYLSAKLDAFASKQVEITIRLPVPKDPDYFITFIVEPQDGTTLAATATAVVPAAPIAAPSRDVAITVEGSYQPAEIVLKKGATARLHFHRKDSSACAGEVLIPGLGVKSKLAPLAETVVEVTPQRSGEFEMTCGMRMLRARVVVRD